MTTTGPLSPYLSYNSATQILTVSTDVTTPIAVQTVSLSASDGIDSTSISYQVSILNTPPTFSTPLSDQII